MGNRSLTVCVMFSILFLGSFSAPLPFMQSSDQISNYQIFPSAFAVGKSFDQCKTGKDTRDACIDWIGSILQQQNSEYREGDGVRERMLLDDLAGDGGDKTKHTLDFSHQARKAGINAYDWLAGWDQYRPLTSEGFMENKCADLNPSWTDICMETDMDTVTYDTADWFPYPVVGLLDVDSKIKAIPGPIVPAFDVHADGILANSAKITSVTYNGGDDAYWQYTLEWQTAGDTEDVAIFFAGHLAITGDGNLGTWDIATEGGGSSNISGGPYHFRANSADGESTGSIDNQIKGSDIVIDPCVDFMDDGLFCNGLETCDPADGSTIPGTAPVCDNGLFCDGDETCNEDTDMCDPGTAPVCSNGLFCDGDETCNEDTDMCDPGTAPVCDNGLFCDGDETCNEDTDMCDPGTAPVCDNGLFCDGDETCNEDTDMCDPGTAPVCDNGLFCDGDETCNEDTDMCDPGTAPVCDNGLFCDGDETCNEDTDMCDPGTAPVCDNGLFCDGDETCNEDTDMCDPGTAPVCSNGLFCDGDETCNEDTDMCDPGTAPVCDNGLFCDGDETCNEDTDMCDPGTAPVCSNGLFCDGDETCNEDTDMCDPGTAPVCDNGLFCDGDETCNEDTDMCDPGTAPVCSNGLFCDGDETCNEDTDMCDPGTAPVCDNGLFCDGDETCNEDTDMCDPGTAPVCGDGVSCTEDSCNEDTDMCESIPDDGACMDDNMCTVGSCDEVLGCVQTNICPGDFTFTQGGWGSTPHGMNPGTVRDTCFTNIGPLNVGSDSGHSLTFIGSTNVENFLPSGGKPGVLTQDQLNPVGKTSAGVFAGQTVALALNVVCSDLPINPPWEGPIGGFEVIDENSICFKLTVDEVLAAAEEVLGGEPSGIPAIDNAKVSELSECVSTINENFNDGGDNGFLGLP